jgi:hypothetical protein
VSTAVYPSDWQCLVNSGYTCVLDADDDDGDDGDDDDDYRDDDDDEYDLMMAS